MVLAPLGAARDRGRHRGARLTSRSPAARWVVYRLGERWFGRAAGALAALLLITRVPILSYGVRAYVDIPYLLLVLARAARSRRRRRARRRAGARAARARRPAAPGGVGSSPASTGCTCCASHRAGCARARAARRRPTLAALALLAARAPLIWVLSDLAITGDPLWSLTNTRHTAQTLDRVTGIANVPEYIPRRIGEILRPPVLVGGGARRRAVAAAGCAARAAARRGRGRARGGRVRGLRRRRAADQHALRVPRRGDPVRLLRRRRVRLDAAGARRPAAAAGGWPAARCVLRRADRVRALRSIAPAHRELDKLARQQSIEDDLVALVRRRRDQPRAADRSACPTTRRSRCSRCT